MYTVSIKHFSHEFLCVAEGWKHEPSAKASCDHLKAAVRILSPSEVKDLYTALLQSNDAYADHPIWDSPILQRLFRMQEAAIIAGVQCMPEIAGDEGKCSCRLVASLPE